MALLVGHGHRGCPSCANRLPGNVSGLMQTVAVTTPFLWPREGVAGSDLTNALYGVSNRASNVPMPTDDPVAAYVRWATESIQTLRPWLQSQDLDHLMRTPAYWAALSMPLGTDQGSRLALDEVTLRRQELQRLIDSLEAFARRFVDVRPTTYVLPDTNVLLEHPGGLSGVDWRDDLAEYLRTFDDVRVVIPLSVVDELDNLKRVHRTEKAARNALKNIYHYFGKSLTARRVLQGDDVDDGQVYAELLMDAPAHVRLLRMDDELIRTAARLSSFTVRQVVFLTYDTGAAFRAAAADVPHVRLTHKTSE